MSTASDRRHSAHAPLLQLTDPSAVLFDLEGEPVTARRFLSAVAHAAAALPDRPYAVNLCADRYRFAVALCAALCRGQITLLPMNPLPETLAGLAREFSGAYVITDEDAGACDLPVWRVTDPPAADAGASACPEIPLDRTAVVLFTSGSTGEPVAHPRSWRALLASTAAAARELGLDGLPGAAVLGTVPHQHSYGLESVCMLALRGGLYCDRTRPLLPADIAARLAALPAPRILVTTPAHLRVLVEDGGPWPELARIVCATAPLPVELAQRAEAGFKAPLYEIYGCTEVGQVAVRRTVHDEAWTCLDGIELAAAEGEVWASGPAAAQRAALNDIIEIVDGRRFFLRGRKSDLVNIAGKRSSLAYLNHRLNAVPGVRDGVFLAPAGEGPAARLTAYVVAPGLAAGDILEALRRVIDPAFLPRPLHVVDALPRNALGKLPQSALAALGTPAATDDDGAVSTFVIAADHPSLAGHFPDAPIVPGALLIDRAIRALTGHPPAAARHVLRHAKFLRPIRPGETVSLRWRRGTGGGLDFEMRVAGHDGPAVVGALAADDA